jgi:integrase
MDDLFSKAGVATPTHFAAGTLSQVEPTLDYIIRQLSADPHLQAGKRRQWITSINSLSKAIGRPPASLPARLTALRHPISRIQTAMHGWAPKTLANHKSNLAAALHHVGQRSIHMSRGAPLLSSWAQLIGRIPPSTSKHVLYGLARYCSALEVPPEDVTNQTICEFFEYRSETSFRECGIARQREVIRAWNSCHAIVEDWPQHRLSEPAPAPISTGPLWEEFQASLRQEVEHYLAGLAKLHRSANGKRRRPCKPSSLQTRRREIVAFARKAVAIGTPIESLTSLDVLIAPALVEQVFDAYRSGQEAPSRYLVELAGKVYSMARTIGMKEEQVLALDNLRYELEQFRSEGLSERNLHVIRAILVTDVWRKVKDLPAVLLQRAKQLLNRNPKKAVSLACVAIQILILTRAPVRVSNLMSIRLGYNLLRPGGPTGRFILKFPEYDVKNRVELPFPLSAATTELLDEFIHLFRSHLGSAHTDDWLFPGRSKNRGTRHASDYIARTLAREVGLRVTAHQFRHAAAAITLKRKPGEFEFVRQLLGHRSSTTTRRFYIALESFSATEAFGKLIEDELDKDGAYEFHA